MKDSVAPELPFIGQPTLNRITCQACTASQYREEHFIRWITALGLEPRFHRQQWELVYVLRALEATGCLVPGSGGLGFGTGGAALVPLITACGATVHVEALERVPDPPPQLDFLWSCSLAGHLGSVEAGLDFLQRSLGCLRPGGIAVHTFDYNVSSDDDTLETASVSLLRRRDLVELQRRLSAAGHTLLPLNFADGSLPEDRHVDLPPYPQQVHLKLRIDRYDASSFGLVIRRF